MGRTDLTNGVAVDCGRSLDGQVTFHYPDGKQVRTTWNRIAMVESLAHSLQDAYELLLNRTQCSNPCPHLRVDVLAQIDEVLHKSSSYASRTGT